MTAYGRDEVISGAESLGIDAFLVKPIETSMLFNALIGLFGNSAGEPVATESRMAPPQFRGVRLLVAEDNPINQIVIREYLSEIGISPSLVSDGAAAVAAVSKAPDSFDAVLMDVQMPVMDGLEATRQIRGALGGQSLPIIAMTAHVLERERARCREAGMDDHLGKPIDPRELAETLGRLIRVGRPLASVPFAGSGAVSAPSIPDRAGPFDFVESKQRLGGNDALLCELLEHFVAEYRAAEVDAALAVGDPGELGRWAHSLKSVADLFGAKDLSGASASVEAAALEGQVDALPTLLTDLRETLRPAVATAEELIRGAVPA